jgi:putative transposase
VTSATLEDVTRRKPEPTAEQLAAEELVRRAREQGQEQGLSLAWPDRAAEAADQDGDRGAPEGELDDHLGYESTTPPSATAVIPATALTEAGRVEISVPRDRIPVSSRESQRRQRHPTGSRTWYFPVR